MWFQYRPQAWLVFGDQIRQKYAQSFLAWWVTILALLIGRAADQVLCLSATIELQDGLQRFLGILVRFPGWVRLEALFSFGQGYRLAPVMVGVAEQAQGPSMVFAWGLKSGRPAHYWVPLSVGTTIWAVHMSKDIGWEYCLGATSRNLVLQNLSAGCCKPLSPLHHNLIPIGQVPLIPLWSPWSKTRVGHSRSDPQFLKNWMSTQGSLFPLEEP